MIPSNTRELSDKRPALVDVTSELIRRSMFAQVFRSSSYYHVVNTGALPRTLDASRHGGKMYFINDRSIRVATELKVSRV